MSKSNELITAHRGESIDAPENTLASINLAWEREAKSVEIDIQLTKDFIEKLKITGLLVYA